MKRRYIAAIFLILASGNVTSEETGGREYGALDYYECVGDDLNIQGILPFGKLAKLKPNETVIFSWIVYKSKAHRIQVNKKVMKDPRMHYPEMPFDPKRMTVGGFKVLVKG